MWDQYELVETELVQVVGGYGDVEQNPPSNLDVFQKQTQTYDALEFSRMDLLHKLI